MNKEQAIHSFWNGFGLPAYDETDVPDDAEMPYITYNVVTDKLDAVINLNASLWYRSTRWKEISDKKEEIAEHIGQGMLMRLNKGRIYIVQGQPFAQRMTVPDDETIRRILINLQVEYLTAS